MHDRPKATATTSGKKRRASSTTTSGISGYVTQASITSYFAPTTATPATARTSKRLSVKGKEKALDELGSPSLDAVKAMEGSSTRKPFKRMREDAIVDLTDMAETQIDIPSVPETDTAYTTLSVTETRNSHRTIIRKLKETDPMNVNAFTPPAQLRTGLSDPQPPSSNSTLFPTPITFTTPSKKTFASTPLPLFSTPVSVASPLRLVGVDDEAHFVPSSQTSNYASPKPQTPSPLKPLRFDRPTLPSSDDELSRTKYTLQDDVMEKEEIIPDSASNSPERVGRGDEFFEVVPSSQDSRPGGFVTPTKGGRQNLFSRRAAEEDHFSTNDHEDLEIVPSSQSQYLSSPPKDWVYGRRPENGQTENVDEPMVDCASSGTSLHKHSDLSQTQEESYAPWAKRLFGLASQGAPDVPAIPSQDDCDTTLFTNAGVANPNAPFFTSPSKSSSLSQTQDESLLPWAKKLLDLQPQKRSPMKNNQRMMDAHSHDTEDDGDEADITAIDFRSTTEPGGSSSSPSKWNNVFSFDVGNIEPSQYTVPSP
ncbi:hypothetical protein FRC03_010372, partial [Tulasnella sp. 419]